MNVLRPNKELNSQLENTLADRVRELHDEIRELMEYIEKLEKYIRTTTAKNKNLDFIMKAIKEDKG